MSKFTTISPKDWKLSEVSETQKLKVQKYTGFSFDDIIDRAKNATYGFLSNHFNKDAKAVEGHYDPTIKKSQPSNLTNLIAPLQFLAMYDMFGDTDMLEKAKGCADFIYNNVTIWWPMHMWQGGVRDTGEMDGQVWVKYTAEALLMNVAVYTRSKDKEYLRRAKQNATFLKQAQRHGFKFVFDEKNQKWFDNGWKSFGRVVEGFLALYDVTENEKYLERAQAWGDYGLTLQSENGCFYLIDDYFYNTDIAPNEIRGMVYLYKATDKRKYLDSAIKYADWHVEHQREDGGWLLAIDRDDEVVCDVVGPGDPANIGISMLALYDETKEKKYLNSAVKALKYSVKMQAVPGCLYNKYLDDPKVLWGFWSWEPTLDWTLCGDQSVHHVRAMFFIPYYIALKQ